MRNIIVGDIMGREEGRASCWKGRMEGCINHNNGGVGRWWNWWVGRGGGKAMGRKWRWCALWWGG